MTARLFSVVFLLLALFGVWFQNAYITSYSGDFEAQSTIGKVPRELLLLAPFLQVNSNQEHISMRLKANEARYFTNGQIVIAGSVQYEDFDEDGQLRLKIQSERALGKLTENQGNTSFFDAKRTLESVNIPGDVEITLGQKDKVKTKQVNLDFKKGILKTEQPVLLTGPGKRVSGKGFEYSLNSREFKLGGRVNAEIDPKMVR